MAFLERGANSGSVSTGSYEIENSVKIEADNTERLYRPWGGITADTKTWTVSVWVKRTELGSLQYVWGAGTGGLDFLHVGFLDDDTLRFRQYVGADHCVYVTNRVFRDTSAWYHIVTAVDTTNGTAGDRLRIYINGVEETSFATETNYSADRVTPQNANGGYMEVGTMIGSARFNGYIAEVNSITGTQYAASDFGEFDTDSGIWKPIAFAGSYAENSVFLEFKDSSSLGTDTSGNSQTFTLQNITAADQATDTPTNNFAMLSSAMHDVNELSYSTISEGGTKFRTTVTEKWVTAVSSIGVTKGKWYAEFVVSGARPNNFWGIASMEQLNNNSGYSSAGSHLGESGKNWSIGYYQANGKLDKQQNSGYTTTSSWGGTVSQNAVVSVALDMDNHNLYMAVNNTYQASGNPVTGANAITFDATETVAIANTGYSLGGGNDTITAANFGGYKSGGMYSQATDGNGYGGFRYAPPTGYYALCTKNLAEFG